MLNGQHEHVAIADTVEDQVGPHHEKAVVPIEACQVGVTSTHPGGTQGEGLYPANRTDDGRMYSRGRVRRVGRDEVHDVVEPLPSSG